MKWNRVEDCLPEMHEQYKDGPKVWRGIVYTGHYICGGSYEESYVRRKASWKHASGHGITVTHWADFPEKPEEV